MITLPLWSFLILCGAGLVVVALLLVLLLIGYIDRQTHL